MTTATTIEVFQQATELGLKLGIELPDTLTLEPAKRCSAEFANILRGYKPELLSLLKLPFCMVFSKVLQEMIFFCEDEDTTAALIEAGADEFSIYTRDELRALVAQNRIAPLTTAELRKVHEIKRTSSGRIAK